jgi:hypothetical protein
MQAKCGKYGQNSNNCICSAAEVITLEMLCSKAHSHYAKSSCLGNSFIGSYKCTAMIILQFTGCLFLRDWLVLDNLFGAKTVAMHTFTHSLSLID